MPSIQIHHHFSAGFPNSVIYSANLCKVFGKLYLNGKISILFRISFGHYCHSHLSGIQLCGYAKIAVNNRHCTIDKYDTSYADIIGIW